MWLTSKIALRWVRVILLHHIASTTFQKFHQTSRSYLSSAFHRPKRPKSLVAPTYIYPWSIPLQESQRPPLLTLILTASLLSSEYLMLIIILHVILFVSFMSSAPTSTTCFFLAHWKTLRRNNAISCGRTPCDCSIFWIQRSSVMQGFLMNLQ